jgi:molybdopterin-binding protein
MQILEQHQSSDGLLKFVVGREDDETIYLGFQGIGWHTHGDILASMSGLPEEAAVRQFVDRLVSGQTIVVVERVGGRICDVRVTKNPAEELKNKEGNESLEFRYWDGTTAA